MQHTQPLTQPSQDIHESIFSILFEQDEVTWQALLMDLVRSEQMDPWDIDISMLAQKYIETIKELKKTDLRISGKVLLAAAILLRVKAHHLLVDDIAQFDNLLNDRDEQTLYEEDGAPITFNKDLYKSLHLIPRTPQPRKRKVTIYDLIEALKIALDIQEKRKLRLPKLLQLELPARKYDLTELMTQVYLRLLKLHRKDKERKVYFTDIVPEQTKFGKIYTFIPLLHLTNQRKLDLDQQEHLGPIEIKVIKEHIDKEIMKEAEEY
ncbi:MAG: hypothetical protein QT07_C0005G0007 [archaeon GW2011_AR16]|nr:MAG: hypothetical protein QT07_C0005G0007 [archaeon GW2011_AR16]